MSVQCIINNINSIMAIRGVTTKHIIARSGLPEETFKNIIYGRVSNIRTSTAVKLAYALDMSVDELVGRKQLTNEQRVLREQYRALPENSRRMISDLCELEDACSRENNELIIFNLVGNMTDGKIFDSCDMQIMKCVDKKIIEDAHFGLYIASNSFAPYYCKGEVLLVSNRKPVDEEIIIALDKATSKLYIRKYQVRDDVILSPISYYGNDLRISRKNFELQWHIVGVVVDSTYNFIQFYDNSGPNTTSQ